MERSNGKKTQLLTKDGSAMNGSKILFDTNVLIRFLNGDTSLIAILENADKYISFLTEIELFCKPNLTDKERSIIVELISNCTVIPYSDELRDNIITLRTKHRLKMPDAFIGATALYYRLPIYTFDTGFLDVDRLDILLPQ